MSTARRWTKWWWQDWQRDPALRMCSPAARGIWMDLLAIMFDAEPCGHLLVNGRQPTERQLAAVCGASIDELSSCLSELEEAGVFSRTEEGVIFNRRMVRDKAISDEASANGKMGGNPTLTGGLNPKREKVVKRGVKRAVKAGVNPHCEGGLTTPLKHQEAEAEADNTSSLRSEGPALPVVEKPDLENIPPDPPPDARTALFRTGVTTVQAMTGKSGRQVRKLIGKWLKDCGDDCAMLSDIIAHAADTRPADPQAFICGAIRHRTASDFRQLETNWGLDDVDLDAALRDHERALGL